MSEVFGSLPGAAVLAPLITALLVGSLPRSEPALARGLGLLGALVELCVLLALVARFDAAGPALQAVVSAAWIPSYGVSLTLGVAGTSLPLLLLLGLIVPLALMIGPRSRPGEPPLVVGVLVLQAAWVTVLLARDLLVLAAAWELATVTAAVLVGERGDGRRGEPGRTAAARRYAAHLLPGAAALIGAVVILGVYHAHATGGAWSWQLDDLAAVTIPASGQIVGFLLLLLALAPALPLLPFNGWMAPVATSGPTPVVALIFGAGMPMAVFLLVHVGMPAFPLIAGEWADPLAALAVVGAIYAALACWAEREPGRLLAHVALLHLALALLGALSGSAGAWGGLGPLLLAHGLALTALTAVFHGLRRAGIRNLGDLAGWASVAPRGASVALLAVLALAGAPGSAGFVGELAVIVGVLREGGVELLRPVVWGVLAALAVSLGTLGLLRSMWHAGRGAPRPGLERRLPDLGLRESLTTGAALSLLLALGLAPGWLLSRGALANQEAVDDLHLGRCLAIEGRDQTRPRTRDEFESLCLDPVGRIAQFYGLTALAAHDHAGHEDHEDHEDHEGQDAPEDRDAPGGAP
ncbi:hypothetical protein G6O69_23330 [Pseudenhygromyxa sp. WMMC2535]|uniref:proton-conducting transporter transmembrane domain-containing protein n=1 Tax=Pseudenhygromyxa sp. WMMC2535 TaxID=2712867 RepID=UPI0015565470|nr:proton-conducting transporter membrane subunit [Pseudenhygromyxa sp. WMMC2535]NVB40792.1 hypothetical protein [Pseudenhygromyxa sp. WMMC2535]